MKHISKFTQFLILSLALLTACTTPTGVVQTEGSGTDASNDWFALPSHIVKDSITQPNHPGKSFVLTAQDPYSFNKGCLSRAGSVARYVVLEFDAAIPAGTEFEGEIPSLSHTFGHTFSANCAENRAFWFLLPAQYVPGQEIILHTHLSTITVDRSHADGLVVIANIDAQDDYDEYYISNSTILTNIEDPKEGGANTGGIKPVKETTPKESTPVDVAPIEPVKK